ncbi:glycine-rich protein 5-like [Punica granatum]|uniref:Uncharacterized protein n=2 Tax=Punica granatum TaxID=22663 RepID=A0A2I0HX25_PUNGR|nr:glycine-rich protein 5-like [Punica granatum]PKI36080.1 hypothetical protein CRG98_043551 [Punica granatum]
MGKVRSPAALVLVLAMVMVPHTLGARTVPTTNDAGGLADQKNFLTYGGVGGYAGLGGPGAGGVAPVFGGVGGVAGVTGPSGGTGVVGGGSIPGVGGGVGGGVGSGTGTGVLPFP